MRRLQPTRRKGTPCDRGIRVHIPREVRAFFGRRGVYITIPTMIFCFSSFDSTRKCANSRRSVFPSLVRVLARACGLRYHPELNAIERFWGYTKSIERRVCDYSVLSLLARLPVTLSTVSLSLCRKWARVSWLYIYAYSDGLEGYLQTRDLKKWTSHRSPTDTADKVLLARGQATTPEERKAKEQAALAAAKEARKKSNEAADKMLKRFTAAKLAPQ